MLPKDWLAESGSSIQQSGEMEGVSSDFGDPSSLAVPTASHPNSQSARSQADGVIGSSLDESGIGTGGESPVLLEEKAT